MPGGKKQADYAGFLEHFDIANKFHTHGKISDFQPSQILYLSHFDGQYLENCVKVGQMRYLRQLDVEIWRDAGKLVSGVPLGRNARKPYTSFSPAFWYNRGIGLSFRNSSKNTQ